MYLIDIGTKRQTQINCTGHRFILQVNAEKVQRIHLHRKRNSFSSGSYKNNNSIESEIVMNMPEFQSESHLRLKNHTVEDPINRYYIMLIVYDFCRHNEMYL